VTWAVAETGRGEFEIRVIKPSKRGVNLEIAEGEPSAKKLTDRTDGGAVGLRGAVLLPL